MALSEAIDAVCSWLATKQSAFIMTGAAETSTSHFEIGVQQIAPINKRRVFKIEPEEVAHCWKVVEVA